MAPRMVFTGGRLATEIGPTLPNGFELESHDTYR